MATGKWCNYQWVPYWRLHVTCFSNTLSHLCCWLCSTMSEEGHYWELLQAHDDVQGWLVFQAPILSFLCSQYWDEVALTASWKALHSRASTHCTVVHSGPRRHGWSKEAFLNRVQHLIAMIDTQRFRLGLRGNQDTCLFGNPIAILQTDPSHIHTVHTVLSHTNCSLAASCLRHIYYSLPVLVVSRTPSLPAIEVSFSHSSLGYMCFFILLWLLKLFSLSL